MAKRLRDLGLLPDEAEDVAPKPQPKAKAKASSEEAEETPRRRGPMTDVAAPEFETSRLHNGQLEFLTLVRVVLDPDLQSRLWPRLSEDHFASDSTRAIYQRLQTMHQSGRDWPKLALLAKDPALPQASRMQLETVLARADRGRPLTHAPIKLPNGQELAVETPADFEGHVFDLLEAYRVTRSGAEQFVDAISALANEEGFDPFQGPAIVEKAASEVLAIRGRESISDVIIHFGHGTTEKDKTKRKDEVRKMIAMDRPRFRTGFAAYDEKAGGIQPGEVVLLGANTGGGKTAMELTLMQNMARMGTSVAMLQLELSLEQINERLSASLANVDSTIIRSGNITPKLQNRIDQAWDEFHDELVDAQSRFTIYAPSEQTVQGCEMVFKQYNYKVWFIDYVNLLTMADNKLQGWEKLSEIVKQFKRLAKKYGIAIVLAVQINIDPDTGDVEIRYAKAMKEHADVVLVWNLSQEARDEGVVWLRHLKARQYESFDFPVRIALNHCRFENFSMKDMMPQKRKLGKKKVHVKDDLEQAQENAKAATFQKKTKPLTVVEEGIIDSALASSDMKPRKTLNIFDDGYADMDEA